MGERDNDWEIGGTTYGTQRNVTKGYVEEKFHGSRGQGFAAEQANNLYDRMTGKNSRIVGDDFAKTVRTESSTAWKSKANTAQRGPNAFGNVLKAISSATTKTK